MAKNMMEPLPPPPFEGFKPKAFEWLRGIAANQNKEWFLAHKPDYEKFVREPLQSLVAELSTRLGKHKSPLRGDPARALMRPYRDVRFSNDKRPYNIHASAALHAHGDKHANGVLYLQIAATDSFVASGFYMMEPPDLQKMRARIAAEPRAWKKIVSNLVKANLNLDNRESLVRVPKGFENAPEELHLVLKLKSFTVSKPLSISVLGSAMAVDDIIDFAKAAFPLLEFGWSALPKA